MIMGLLLFLNPEGIISIISIIIGAFAILYGVTQLIIYFKNRNLNLGYTDLMIGLFAFVSGILLVSNTNIIATIIPIIIGVCMIMMGVKKLDLSLKFKDSNVTGWSYMLIMSILTILCGIVLIINPIKGAFIATKVVGIIIVIYSVIDVIDSIIWKDNVKKITKIIEQ
jgi:uncharacterized membrane protein HdeD (DUF308 family)